MKRFKRILGRWPLIWPYFIFMAVALFILWSQKNSRAFFVGADAWFHLNQFYESAMQIKTGHFSWFLTLFGYGQVGRVVNALYGPVFSYLMGGLLLFVGTWFRFQITVEFIVLSLSGMSMYHLARYVRIHRGLSVILGLIYMVSYPVTELVNEQTFAGIGNAIIPFVILQGVKLWRRHRVNVVPLAVTLAIVLQIHLMTAVMSVAVLIPFGIASFLSSSRKFKWLGRLLLSVGLFFLLTFNIWGTMLDVFHGNNVIRPFPVTSMGSPRFSLVWFNGTVSLLNSVYVVLGAIVIALLAVEWRHLSADQKFVPFLSLLFIWLASAYFPWRAVERRVPAISQSLQFPSRFLGVAMVLFLLTLGLGIKDLPVDVRGDEMLSFFVYLGLILIAVGVVTAEEGTVESHTAMWRSKQVFVSNDSNLHPEMPLRKLRAAYHSRDLTLADKDTVKSISDYLPSSQPANGTTYRQIHPKSVAKRELFRFRAVTHRVRPKRGRKLKTWISSGSVKSPLKFKKSVTGHGLTIKWRQPRSLANHWTQVPAVKYRHTVVTVNHRSVPVKIDRVGAIHVRPRAGWNQLTLRYQASQLWAVMMIITAVSWLSLIGYLLVRWFK